MPIIQETQADAVTAVDKWLKVSKQNNSLGTSASRFVDDLRNGRNSGEWSSVNIEQILP